MKETGPKFSRVSEQKKLSETGVISDHTKASREKGEAVWKLAIERLADLLKELDEMKF